MIDRLSARPLLRRGLGLGVAGLLVAGAMFVPATALAAGDPPVAVDDVVNGTEDTALVIPVGDLLGNDGNVDGDTLRITVVENNLHGIAVLNGPGTQITFTPEDEECDDGATALGSFNYDVTDDIDGTDIGFVSVHIACVNDQPVAFPDHAPNGHQDDVLELTSADLVSNDLDVDHDALAVSAVSNPTGGAVVLAGTDITFTPTQGLCGDNAGGFDYTVSDGHGGTNGSSVTIDLACNGTNHDPVAGNDTGNGTEDVQLVFSNADLVGNDTDADAGDVLTVTDTSGATGGTAVLASHQVTFTPTHNLCGPGIAGFNYTVSDGTDTDIGHVTISLACINDAPVANPDQGFVDQGSGPADYDVLANDTDPEHSALSLVLPLTVDPAKGTASINGTKVSFTPAALFAGTAVITYTVSDGTVTSSGELTVLVGPDDVEPVAARPAVAFAGGKVVDTAKLKITWSATDLGAGVGTYQAQARIGTGAWKTIASGTATKVTKAFPIGKTLAFRVRATDKAGNVSDWATAATRRMVAYQHSGKAVDYTGSWTRVRSNHPYAFTTKLGKAAKLTFTGRSVLYVAPLTRASGFAKVYVDGTLLGRINLRNGSTVNDLAILGVKWAANGQHAIRIVNDKAGKQTNLARFVVLK